MIENIFFLNENKKFVFFYVDLDTVIHFKGFHSRELVLAFTLKFILIELIDVLRREQPNIDFLAELIPTEFGSRSCSRRSVNHNHEKNLHALESCVWVIV